MAPDPPTIPDSLARYATALGPAPDEVLREMGHQAEREGFPYVGPEVGGWLATLVGLTGARRVFEFGSGFGYSAYWMARELPDDGQVVLTEIDADELDQAREYFDRGGLSGLARFEHGDAIEIVTGYDGPMDLVLIDCQKARYAEAFEQVREKIPPGGVAVADNVVAAGTVVFDDLLAHVEGDSVSMNESTQGIADYLDAVRADPAFSTAFLPMGEGITVSYRRR